MENCEYKHTKIIVDGRCLDLLMTEEEITTCFERCLLNENEKYIDQKTRCSSWPLNMPPECSFWKKILGMCRECDK